MRVGFAKIGRSMRLTSENWGIVGGDQETVILLRKLAAKYPEHTFSLIGRNSGELPSTIGLPSNVVNPWIDIKPHVSPPRHIEDSSDAKAFADEMYTHFRDYIVNLDAFIIFIGQHGTSNNPVPKVGFDWGDDLTVFTKPQTSFLNYSSYIIRGLNEWGDRMDGLCEPIFICTDARNNIKCRDLKWPPREPVLALYDQRLSTKHDRWKDPRSPDDLGFNKASWVGEEDPGVWYNYTDYVYSGVEVATILPYAERTLPNLKDYDERRPFGMVVNEARAYVQEDRLSILKEWVMPIPPTFVHGEWSEESLKELGVPIKSVTHRRAFDRLATVRCTLTTPSSGSGWATRKPWESFASGVVCFFHPTYDTQGHIIPTNTMMAQNHYSDEVKELVRWLRCINIEDFRRKLAAVVGSKSLWCEIVDLQYQLFSAAVGAQRLMTMIDKRLEGVRAAWAEDYKLQVAD